MGYRILVVDDEAHIVQVLLIKLRNAGHQVLTAIDGEEGTEVAIREQPDLVITDLHMEYRNGLELARALRSEPTTAHIPIIMLTAQGFNLAEEAIAGTGIREVMSKPFGPREVLRRVEQILAETAPRAGNSEAA